MKLSESFEDYLEIIYLIKKDNGYVKSKDISKRLNVKSSSVNEAVKKLDKKGFVEYKKYGLIKLTKKGEEKAKKVYKKHKFLLDFLTKELGVKENIALEEACKTEHILSKDTLLKFSKFVKTCKTNSYKQEGGE